MNSCSKLSRAIAHAALAAALASCGADERESYPAAVRADSGGGVVTGAADPPRLDTAASAARPGAEDPGADVLTPDGWGPLRIGMTRAEVVAAAGEDANPDAVGGPEPERCDEFRPSRAPAGILVMVEEGVLTRISLSRNPDITTPEGLGVGDRGSSVLQAYGPRARVEPHKYWPGPARYITVWREPAAGTERRGLRFEVDADDRVVHIRGGSGSIEYVEGCL